MKRFWKFTAVPAAIFAGVLLAGCGAQKSSEVAEESSVYTVEYQVTPEASEAAADYTSRLDRASESALEAGRLRKEAEEKRAKENARKRYEEWYKEQKEKLYHSHSGHSGNPYPTSPREYSDFEDFYYDNEEDFEGLDDAEDYYNEHGGEW